MLKVTGANIHYTLQGAGPLLLVLQGGAAGVEGSDGLAAALGKQRTLLSHDRRGLANSPLEGAQETPFRLQTHVDDVHRLLAHLTSEPVDVLGVSIGAMIGLDLLSRYPSQVKRLVAFEPPAVELLAPPQRAAAEAVQAELEAAYREKGAMAAMRVFARALGLANEPREPGLAPPAPSAERLKNIDVFFRQDAEAVQKYVIDFAALERSKQALTMGVGKLSLQQLDQGVAGAAIKALPAIWLAKRFQVPLLEFPGGHGGYASMPKAFGARLLEAL